MNKKIRSHHSLVAIRTKSVTLSGLGLIDLDNPNRSLPVTGEAISVSGRFDKSMPLSYVNNVGMEYDVPIEIKEGDTVLFLVRARQDREFGPPKVGDVIFVRYSDIIARVDNNDLYPLNGALLATPVDLDPKTQRNGLLWNITKKGCLVKNYMSFPEDGPDEEVLSDLVLVRNDMPIPVEPWGSSRFLVDGNRQYILHRRHILAYVQA